MSTASKLLISLLFFQTACQAQPQQLTKEEWLEDLEYLAKQLPKKHANLFHAMAKIDFEKAVNELKNRIPSLTDNEIKVEFIKIVAIVKDGHTDVAPSTYNLYPVRFGYYGNDLFVVSATEEHTSAIGGIVTKIGNMSVQEAAKLIESLVDGDNEMEIPRKVPEFLLMPEILNGLKLVSDSYEAEFTVKTDKGENYVMKLKPVEGQTPPKLISARAKANSKIPMYMENVTKHYWFTYLPESKTLYFQYNSIAKFAEEMFAIADSKEINRMVVDLRHNPGGNFNKSEPLVEGIRKRNKLSTAGNLYVLTSRNTGSAATVTGAQLKVHANATIVGELSRCNPNFTYNSERFTLPNSKLSVGYTESLHKPFPQLGNSLPVDIQVDNSFEDYRVGRDHVLETIVKMKKH
jgi:hypothetical protein